MARSNTPRITPSAIASVLVWLPLSLSAEALVVVGAELDSEEIVDVGGEVDVGTEDVVIDEELPLAVPVEVGAARYEVNSV